MQIAGGLDVHRAQITFDCVDLHTGEEIRGQIKPATREEVRTFFAGFGKKSASFALEATTGWCFIVEELRRAGIGATPRRTGGHPSSAWSKASSEDRSCRRAHWRAKT